MPKYLDQTNSSHGNYFKYKKKGYDHMAVSPNRNDLENQLQDYKRKGHEAFIIMDDGLYFLMVKWKH